MIAPKLKFRRNYLQLEGFVILFWKVPKVNHGTDFSAFPWSWNKPDLVSNFWLDLHMTSSRLNFLVVFFVKSSHDSILHEIIHFSFTFSRAKLLLLVVFREIKAGTILFSTLLFNFPSLSRRNCCFSSFFREIDPRFYFPRK